MAESTSVGNISLELIINSQIERQLERIRARASAPADRTGEEISRRITERTERIADNVNRQLEDIQAPDVDFAPLERSAEETAREIDEAVSRAIQRMSESNIEPLEIPEPRSVQLGENIYNTRQIEESISESIERPIRENAERIQNQLSEFEVSEEPAERLNQQLENTAERIQLLQRRWQELSDSSTESEVSDRVTSQLNSVERQIIQAQESYNRLQQRLERLNTEQSEPEIPDTSDIPQIDGIDPSVMERMTETANEIRDRFSNTFGNIRNTGAKAVDSLKSGFSGLRGGVEKLSKPLKKVTGIFDGLGKSIKSAFKSVFLMASLYALFKGLKAVVSEAINRDDELVESLNAVKANLQVAFTPIVDTVMPYLKTLMSGVVSLSTAIASLVAGIFGTTYEKALETTKAVKSTTEESVKSAEKAKGSLAGFDKITTISSGSDSSEDNADEGTDFSALNSEGNKSAENLGKKIRQTLIKAFEKVGKKAKSIFDSLKKWATVSFAPTFYGIWDGLKSETEELKAILGKIFSDICSLGEPLKQYFAGDFTVFLQTAFATIGNIILTLYDTFNKVFSDIWNVVVFPIIESFVIDGLPIITQFATESMSAIDVLFEEIMKIFNTVWDDVVKPILEGIAKLWKDLMGIIKDFWNKWGKPIFENLRTAFKKTGDTFQSIWNNLIKPVWDKFMEVVGKLWTNHLKPFLANFLDLVGEIVNGALEIYNKFILPVVDWFSEKFGKPISNVIGWIMDVIGGLLGHLVDCASGIIDALKGIVNFVVGVFTGDWERAWTGIKDFFKGIWDAFVEIVKAPINMIIDLVNGLVGAIETGLNWIIDGINSISIDLPKVVSDVVGVDSFGFNVPNVDIPDIPHLAKGGLAYAPQLAMVGDNRNARTDPEVIAPLSKLNDMGIGANTEVIQLLKIIVELLRNGVNIELVNYLFKDSREFSREVLKAVNDNAKRGGS